MAVLRHLEGILEASERSREVFGRSWERLESAVGGLGAPDAPWGRLRDDFYRFGDPFWHHFESHFQLFFRCFLHAVFETVF